MKNQGRVKIVLFAGGRGASTIARSLALHPQIDLTLLLNAYDDGLSTGRLRRFIPGMLGPSDIRKNYSQLLPSNDEFSRALKKLLEHRFPEKVDGATVLEFLRAVAEWRLQDSGELTSLVNELSLKCAQELSSFCRNFLEYYETERKAGNDFDFGDCSLGNLIFAGCFLAEKKDFNRCIERFCRLYPIRTTILNVTLGENLILVGVKEDGLFLKNEAEIVSAQSASKLAQIFLLRDYLSPEEAERVGRLSLSEKIVELNRLSVTPQINKLAEESLRKADIIVYGPGTQHSSLLPSYLTDGVGWAISLNRKAEKIFISNLREDHEIQGETVNTLVRKLWFYLNRKGIEKYAPPQLITRCFFQKKDHQENGESYIRFDTADFILPAEHYVEANWEVSQGVHLGGRVAEEIVSIANARVGNTLEHLPYMVSLIVPALDEAKTVRKILHDLKLLDLESLGIRKEIIFVDGGSKDGTYEIAMNERDIRCFRLSEGFGRGRALRLGIEKALGNLIVFFPSDAEYNTKDLTTIVPILMRNEFGAIFGSRAIKHTNFSRRIREIYQSDYLGYLIGNYGGMLLSGLCLLLYRRFISDPLTGVKGFQASLLKNLVLHSDGLDLETELIAKLAREGVFILEVPVDYYPRKKTDGKKTTVWDGVSALFALLKYRFGGVAKHAQSIHYRSSLQRS